MLAAFRELKIAGSLIAETPIVVPSFSSKGFPDVSNVIDSLSEVITESALISAYDLSYGFINSAPSYPSYLFLDSGGYECSKDMELSDIRNNTHRETEWSMPQLEKVLDGWSSAQPTIAVSYDHPKHRLPVAEQIQRASALFQGRRFGKEILLKPSSVGATRIDVPEVIGRVYDYKAFDVLGFTEKELGYSVFDRMVKIARIRKALDGAGLNLPIHIFGSLDTISTPLYFISGADIFDGLTWLRYCYLDGQAVYQKNAAVLKYGIRINDSDVDPKIWFENYQQMLNMELSMRRYLREKGDFSVFKHFAELFRQSHGELLAKV